MFAHAGHAGHAAAGGGGQINARNTQTGRQKKQAESDGAVVAVVGNESAHDTDDDNACAPQEECEAAGGEDADAGRQQRRV